MKPTYLPSLDGIRACAVTLVFMAHAGLGKLVPGGFGVTVFFALSGFLITSLLRSEFSATGTISLRNFYRRRALRILPPLYLAIAFFWLLDRLPHGHHHTTALGLSSLLFYFFNYGFPPHLAASQVPTGLGVAWSLMVEEHFYLLFPLLYLFLARTRKSARSTAIVLTGLCLAALLWRCFLVFLLRIPLAVDFPWTYVATDARFDSILWGCVLAIAANPWCGDVRPTLTRHKGPLACAGLLLIVATLCWREEAYRQTLRYTLQSLALLPVFFYIVSSPDAWQTRWLASKPLRWLGWVSYTFYLVHFGILEKLRTYTTWPPLFMGLAALVLSLFAAEIVRRLVELPLRRLTHSTRRVTLAPLDPAKLPHAV